MQRFLDNWSAVLTQPATAAALQLHITPDSAQRLAGLDAGDHYQLTLAKVEEVGGAKVETAWEFVNVTATDGGQLTVHRLEGAQDWPAGTLISCRFSASTLMQMLEQLQSQGLALAQAEQQILSLMQRVDALEQASPPGGSGLTDYNGNTLTDQSQNRLSS